MGKQITAKKRAFAEAYKATGSVRAACDQAGYTSHQAGYRFMKRDTNGELLDPVMRSLLGEAMPEPLPLPEPIKRQRKVAAELVRRGPREPAEVVRLEVIPRGGDISISRVRELLLALAEDENTPAGPRVQALNILLKDLRDEQVPEVPDDSEVLGALEEKLNVRTA
jgi:hypothetical protein